MKNIQSKTKSICIVTEEWPGIPGCGGIGTAFYELATLLAKNDWAVHVLYVPMENFKPEGFDSDEDVTFHCLNLEQYIFLPYGYEKKSYAVAQWLQDIDETFDTIHFCDYKGLGFAATSLKSQKLAFASTTLCVQLHGFTRWATELNNTFFDHEDQILIDHLERQSSLNADYIISPSAYLVNWSLERGYIKPESLRKVIPNASISLEKITEKSKKLEVGKPEKIKEIIFVGRHETRKSLDSFVQAILSNATTLIENNIQITIIGNFGLVNEIPSGLYLLDHFGPAGINLSLKTGFNRFEVIDYLTKSASPLVVIPSVEENSPYTVLEPLALGIPVITSNRGGAPELFSNKDVKSFTFDPNANALSEKIAALLSTGIRPATVSMAVKNSHSEWLSTLTRFSEQARGKLGLREKHTDLVTVGITHYERPDKIIDAVTSILVQDYKNIELLIVDDGSKTEAARETLEYVETLISRIGGRLIKQKNTYLGGARNKLISEASGDFIIFLDDDNYALPKMVSTLLQAIKSNTADVVTAQSIFMPLLERDQMIAKKEYSDYLISYVPTGGPVSLAGVSNVFGDASGIYKTSVLKAVGGYTELRNVGYEDYELYTRIATAGYDIQSCPTPLYLYEIGRPSMLTKNSLIKDYQRVFTAIKSGGNADKYMDFIQIGIGKKVKDLALNRKHWEYSQHEDSELMLPMLIDANNKENYQRCLLQLAVNRGYKNIVSAVLDNVSGWIPASPKKKTTRPLEKYSLASSGNLHILRQACWNDDPNAFAKIFSQTVANSFTTSEVVVQSLNIWISRVDQDSTLVADLDQTAATLLASSLVNKKITTGAAAGKILLGALCSCGSIDAFKTIFKAIYDAETEAYLDTYEDVRSAFSGSPKQAFHHFVNYASTENRTGFSTTFPVVKFCLNENSLPDFSDYIKKSILVA